jgi:hypothetical protein
MRGRLMNAIVPPSDLAPSIEFYAYCDTCGALPCIYPAFCNACRAADQKRNTFKISAVDADLKSFAARAAELAGKWRSDVIGKADAVDRAYNFAVALGLHYRLDKGDKRRPEDIIQQVLSTAFAPERAR